MSNSLRMALACSIGIHAGVFFGWPATSPVVFDVERAPTSLEILLVAPRAAPLSPQTVAALPAVEVAPEALPDVQQEPEPAPQTIVTPESQGALSEILPGYLRNPAPRYPLQARRRGEEGAVVLRAEVLPTGRCGRLDVRSSSGFASLDEAAMSAVKRWQFKPAARGRAPVAVWVEIPVTFQLVEPMEG